MKPPFRPYFSLLAIALLTAGSAHADTIAQWTFETVPPTSSGTLLADDGIGTAFAHHADSSTVYSSPTGNGSAHSWASDHWSVGDYYQFNFSAAGYYDLSLSFSIASDTPGPAKFGLSYSTDGVNFTRFTPVDGYDIYESPVWNSSNQDFTYLNGFNSPFPAETVAMRIYLPSNVGENGLPVTGAGKMRIDDVWIQGAPVPEPGTWAALALGAGVVLRRRKRA